MEFNGYHLLIRAVLVFSNDIFNNLPLKMRFSLFRWLFFKIPILLPLGKQASCLMRQCELTFKESLPEAANHTR